MGTVYSSDHCCGPREGEIQGQKLEDWLKNPDSGVQFPLPPSGNGCCEFSAKAEAVLESVLAIERICQADSDSLKDHQELKDMRVEILSDEPTVRYCLCHSPESSLVTGFFWTVIEDVSVEDVCAALLLKEERHRWDEACEFNILREASPDDYSHEEVIFHVLKAVWPFWDRDVLQKRWRLNLPEKGAVALVMQSVDDPSLHPLQPQVVRAKVHLSGQLLRPMAQASDGRKGIELTVCTKVDIGGIIPDWAQSLLARLASQRSQSWAARLRDHCVEMGGKSAAYDEEACDELIEPEMMGL